MRAKKTTLWASLAVISGMVLSGCSSSSDSVSYWGAFYAPPTQEVFQKTFVDEFNKSADVPVKMDVKQLTNLGQLTETAVSAGRGPYADGPSSASAFANADRLAPLDEYATKYGWADKLLPWAYDLGKVNGGLYSVPTGYGSLVLYYNKEVFAANNWTAPTTLQEFESIAQEATSKGMIALGGGNSGYQAMSEWLLTSVLNAGVGPEKLYDVLMGKAKFTDPEFVEIIDLIKSWVDKKWLAGGSESYFTTDDTANFTGLADGSVAMYMTGTWSFGSAGSFSDKPDWWDWAPLPSFSDAVEPGVYPLAIGTTLSVNAKSKNPAAAAAFIDFIIGDTARSLSYTAATGENPPPLNVSASDFPSSVDERTTRLYASIPQTTNVGYASWTFFPPQTDTFMWTEFDKIVTGSQSSLDYLKGLQAVFEKEKSAGKTLVPFAPAH